jgi:hypothetical protein
VFLSPLVINLFWSCLFSIGSCSFSPLFDNVELLKEPFVFLESDLML